MYHDPSCLLRERQRPLLFRGATARRRDVGAPSVRIPQAALRLLHRPRQVRPRVGGPRRGDAGLGHLRRAPVGDVGPARLRPDADARHDPRRGADAGHAGVGVDQGRRLRDRDEPARWLFAILRDLFFPEQGERKRGVENADGTLAGRLASAPGRKATSRSVSSRRHSGTSRGPNGTVGPILHRPVIAAKTTDRAVAPVRRIDLTREPWAPPPSFGSPGGRARDLDPGHGRSPSPPRTRCRVGRSSGPGPSSPRTTSGRRRGAGRPPAASRGRPRPCVRAPRPGTAS